MRNSLSIFLGHKSTHLTMKNKLQFQKYFTEICFKRCGRYRRMHCFRKWIGNKPFLKAMLTQNYVASYGAFSSLAICLCFFFSIRREFAPSLSSAFLRHCMISCSMSVHVALYLGLSTVATEEKIQKN